MVPFVFIGDDCPESYDHSYEMEILSPTMFQDYIKLNKSTGEIKCTDFLTASEKDYPESITVTIKGQLISWNIFLAKIEYKILCLFYPLDTKTG